MAALKKAPGACLNLVQCTGSMHYVAMAMEQSYGIPYMDVNFFGAENTAESLRKIADFFGDEEISSAVLRRSSIRETNAIGPAPQKV